MKDSSNLDFSVYDDLNYEAIESLRLILEEEQGTAFTHDEAKEIGVGLLKLFEALSNGEEPEEVEEESEAVEVMATQLSFI